MRLEAGAIRFVHRRFMFRETTNQNSGSCTGTLLLRYSTCLSDTFEFSADLFVKVGVRSKSSFVLL